MTGQFAMRVKCGPHAERECEYEWQEDGPVAATAPSPASAVDWYADIALAIARSILAPPPLDCIDDGALLAVAAAPGMDPDEWSPAAPGAWVAWPGRAGAGLHDEVMTAGQLRALLARRDAG